MAFFLAVEKGIRNGWRDTKEDAFCGRACVYETQVPKLVEMPRFGFLFELEAFRGGWEVVFWVVERVVAIVMRDGALW